MVVDSHVHGRDFNETRKETVAHAMAVAKSAGVSGVFFMPNTSPSLTERSEVADYIRLIDEAGVKGVFGGVYVGLTADVEQVKRAVGLYREFFPRIVGFKMYAGHSTNNLGVIREEDQQRVIDTLTREDYRGVLFVHAEKEAHMNNALFDYKRPISHSELARPEIAEVASAKDILKFCKDALFTGKLHFAHISTPAAVREINRAKLKGQDVSCGITPHHLWLENSLMNGPNGADYKVNPPLREIGSVLPMLNYLKAGYIDWVETDHAPHLLGEKRSEKCPSGLPGLHAWRLFQEMLKRGGFSDNEIYTVTHGNICDRFGIDIPFTDGGDYDPKAYEVDVWGPLEKIVGWSRK